MPHLAQPLIFFGFFIVSAILINTVRQWKVREEKQAKKAVKESLITEEHKLNSTQLRESEKSLRKKAS